MTTLIDRILSQIIPAFVDYNLRTKKHIIEYWDTPETFQLAEDRLNIEKQLEYNLRQILEAELTAVNGVDDVCTACYGKGKYSVYEWDQVLEPDFCWDKPLLYKKWWIKEYLCPKCWGKSEQSQAEKVVEIKYVIRKCVCKTTLWLSDNYCPNCWAKIKWIA